MTGARMRPHMAGIAVMLAAAICISLSNVLSPLVYSAGGTVAALLLARFAVFPCLCFLWLRLQRVPAGLPARQARICYGGGLFYTAGRGGLIGSFGLLPVSLAILIFFTFPLITALMESALERRPPGVMRLACIVLALAGLAIAPRVDLTGLTVSGVTLAALAALCVAVAFVWTGHMLKGVEPTVMTFHMALAGLCLAAAYAAFGGNFAIGVDTWADAAVFAGAVLTFGGAFLAMYSGVRLVGASQAAMLLNMEPVFTIVLAVALLGERLTPVQATGAGLVIAAVLWAQHLHRKEDVSGGHTAPAPDQGR